MAQQDYEIAKLKKQLESKEDEIQQLREQASSEREAAEAKVTQVVARVPEIKRQLQAQAAKDTEKLNADLADLRSELEMKDKHLMDAAKFGQQLLEENKELTASLSAASSARDANGSSDAKAKEQMKKMQAQIEELEAEIKRSKEGSKNQSWETPSVANAAWNARGRVMSDLMHTNAELEDQMSQLEQERKHFKELAESLQNEVLNLQLRFESMDPETTRPKRTSHVSGAQRMGIRGALHFVFSDVRERRLHRRLEEEETRVAQLELQVRQGTVEKEQAQRDHKNLRAQLVNTTQEARTNRYMMRDAENQLTDHRLKVQDLQANIQQLKEKVQDSAAVELQQLAKWKLAEPSLNTLYADLKMNFDEISDLDEDDDKSPDAAGVDSSSDEESNASSRPEFEDKTKYADMFPMQQPASSSSTPSVAKFNKTGGYQSAYMPKGGFKTNRERKIAALSAQENHKKLLQALHLVELLHEANRNLQQEVDMMEDAEEHMKRIQNCTNIAIGVFSAIIMSLGTALVMGWFDEEPDCSKCRQ